MHLSPAITMRCIYFFIIFGVFDSKEMLYF